MTTVPRKIHGSKSARRHRQSPLEYAPATVSRPSRPEVTTVPRKTHRSKSARCHRQSPPEYAPARVLRPWRPKVTTVPHKIHGFKSAEDLRPVVFELSLPPPSATVFALPRTEPVFAGRWVLRNAPGPAEAAGPDQAGPDEAAGPDQAARLVLKPQGCRTCRARAGYPVPADW